MKSLVFTLLLMVLGGALVGGPALAGDQDFQLFNRTGCDIHHLYVSPSNQNSWEDDMLDGKSIQNGADVMVRFSGSAARLWDVKVVDEDGTAVYWEDVDLITAEQVILEPNGVARIK